MELCSASEHSLYYSTRFNRPCLYYDTMQQLVPLYSAVGAGCNSLIDSKKVTWYWHRHKYLCSVLMEFQGVRLTEISVFW